MDPVGMTNACTSVVVPNSSNRMVMAHSAIAPRGGSALAAGCGATGSVTVVFWSVGGFIAPALSVYQGVGAGTERSPRARYRYSPAATRSPRLENRCYPRHRASRAQEMRSNCAPNTASMGRGAKKGLLRSRPARRAEFRASEPTSFSPAAVRQPAMAGSRAARRHFLERRFGFRHLRVSPSGRNLFGSEQFSLARIAGPNGVGRDLAHRPEAEPV